jgi:beta-glucosidase/6-phospho-beta-glucosidase/beta-galactosidase
LGGAFDAGHIRGWTPGFEAELDFHQLEITGHAQQLESDYALFRQEFGLHMYRDGAWLARSFPSPGQYNWSHLDRLAALSDREVTLSICHYEWPIWAVEEDLWSGRVVDEMAEFSRTLAERYRGYFAAYIPVVESGYWVAMMTEWGRWWPATGKEKARRNQGSRLTRGNSAVRALGMASPREPLRSEPAVRHATGPSRPDRRPRDRHGPFGR